MKFIFLLSLLSLLALTLPSNSSKDLTLNTLLGIQGIEFDTIAWSNEKLSLKAHVSWQTLNNLIETSLNWKMIRVQALTSGLMVEGVICF